jgi:hypothetical protein
LGEAVHVALGTAKPKARYAVIPQRFKNWTLPRLLPARMVDAQLAKLAHSTIELPGAVPQRTEHFPSLLFAEHHALAEIVRELRVALNKEPIYDPAIVCNDISNVHREFGVRQTRILREQHKVQVFLEILHQNVEALMRQFHHSLLRKSGYQIARDMVLDAEPVRRLFV